MSQTDPLPDHSNDKGESAMILRLPQTREEYLKAMRAYQERINAQRLRKGCTSCYSDGRDSTLVRY